MFIDKFRKYISQDMKILSSLSSKCLKFYAANVKNMRSHTVAPNMSRQRLVLCYVVAVQRFFFSSGPRAYVLDAPQPVGLLCYPSVLHVPTFATSPSPRPCYPRDP
jgi:hypothetical protein